MTENELANKIIGIAIEIHKTLGPGLLESAYLRCLAHELKKHGLSVEQGVEVPVYYDGIRLEAGLRLDLLVEKSVVVEPKSVETVLPVHTAQVLTCLKLSGYRLGLLINFNVPLIRDGIRQVVT